MEYRFTPKGVCSTQIIVEVEEGIIQKLIVENGCHGNLQGISKLVEGMKIEEVIKRLEGIDCRGRGTSCPDQIAKMLKQIV
ncbi:MAG: TIGR03905 family TSCPD domain-containing protein [Clostridia bacterium]|jgi:uncharacterized protein (TIGR03905 family)|nr:TIGR03905 family TSCPD domain-containing protein [Clostridia bacterium]